MPDKKVQVDIVTTGDTSGAEKVDASLKRVEADAEAINSRPPPQVIDAAAPQAAAQQEAARTAQINLTALKAQSAEAQALVNTAELQSNAIMERGNIIAGLRNGIQNNELLAIEAKAAGETVFAGMLERENIILQYQVQALRAGAESEAVALEIASRRLVAEESILASQIAQGRSGLLAGVNLKAAGNQAVQVATQIANGKLEAGSLAGLLAKFGPALGIGTVAAFGLQSVIEAATKAQEEQNKKVEALGANYEKVKTTVKDLFANAKNDTDENAARLKTAQDLAAVMRQMVGTSGQERDILEIQANTLDRLLRSSETQSLRKREGVSLDQQILDNQQAQFAAQQKIADLEANANKQRGPSKTLSLDKVAAEKAGLDLLIRQNEELTKQQEKENRINGLNDETTAELEKQLQLRRENTAAAADLTQKINDGLTADASATAASAAAAFKKNPTAENQARLSAANVAATTAQGRSVGYLTDRLKQLGEEGFNSFGVVIPAGTLRSTAFLEASKKTVGQAAEELKKMGTEAAALEKNIRGVKGAMEEKVAGLEDPATPASPNRLALPPRQTFATERDRLDQLEKDSQREAELNAAKAAAKAASDKVEDKVKTFVDNSQKGLDDLERKVEAQTAESGPKAEKTLADITDKNAKTSEDLQKKVDETEKANTDAAKTAADTAKQTVANSSGQITEGFTSVSTSVNDLSSQFLTSLEAAAGAIAAQAATTTVALGAINLRLAYLENTRNGPGK